MKYLICNLKSNLNLNEIVNYEHGLREFPKYNTKLVICPSYPYLVFFRKGEYSLGSQDLSNYQEGDYTGEVNAKQLKSMNVTYCLIGHSERRKYFKEGHDVIIKKIKNALKNNIIPIYIIGETKEEKLRGKTMTVLNNELNRVLNSFTEEELKKFIIAYEPIWAINSSEYITKNALKEIVLYIKDFLNQKYNIDIPIIYGGGINNKNTLELLPLVDGYLISSSALKIDTLEEIYNKMSNFDKN